MPPSVVDPRQIRKVNIRTSIFDRFWETRTGRISRNDQRALDIYYDRSVRDERKSFSKDKH